MVFPSVAQPADRRKGDHCTSAPPHSTTVNPVRGGGEDLGFNLYRLLQPLPGHEDPEKGVGGGGDGEGGVFRVDFILEGDEVVGVAFHLGQPIDEELVGLLVGETKGGQGFLQEGGGFISRDHEAFREVILHRGDALPEEAVVGPSSGGVGEGAVGVGGDGPTVLIGGVGGGELAMIVQLDVDGGLFLGIEVEDGFGVILDSRGPAAR